MRYLIPLIILTGLVAFWTNTLQARFGSIDTDAIQKPVVIELFTSQSCSSCPAADKNLAALSKNPNVIALGFHVTYWNHLHWEDTLSQQFSTQRQRAYASYKNNNRVYTPQMIINGDKEFIGSRSGDATRFIKAAKEVQPITLKKTSASKLTATLPKTEKAPYVLWLAGIKDQHIQDTPSGENRGRKITYHNSVQSLEKLGSWDGTAKTLNLDIQNPNLDRYVILAQTNAYGPIAAAGKSN